MSDYSIAKLTDFDLTDPPKKKFLLDANIWINVIRSSNKNKEKAELYREFFFELVDCKGANIILPALVVSEVMNRLLREIYLKKFIERIGAKEPLDSKFYKEQFRPSNEYRSGCMLIADEFKTYLQSLELKNDEFGKSIKYKHVLSKFDFGLDFNDSFLYYLAKKNNYIIVTDDGDFCVKGVDVLTLNKELLKKSSKM